METPSNAAGFAKLDPKLAIDGAKKTVLEERRERDRQWWIGLGMPPELNYEDGKTWAVQRQKQSDEWMAAWEKWKWDLYAEVYARNRQRLLRIGFCEEELLPPGYLPNFISANDPRYADFQQAMKEMDEDSKAVEVVLLGDQRYQATEVAPPPAVVPVTPAMIKFTHSPDFRSVHWFGRTYSFTANQAPVIRVLYEAYVNRTPDVGDETLLAAVDLEQPPERLNVLFRDNPAWNTMIVSGATRGTHRLSELDQS